MFCSMLAPLRNDGIAVNIVRQILELSLCSSEKLYERLHLGAEGFNSGPENTRECTSEDILSSHRAIDSGQVMRPFSESFT